MLMHSSEAQETTDVRCPFCTRMVGTFTREGVVLMLGHRVSAMPMVGTPWCQGGGRSPK